MKPDSASSVSLASSPPPSSAPPDCPPTPALITRRTRALRNSLLCALLFLAAFWISRPVAQMGFVDDWSYIKTAQVFAQTGHFVYNGWATAMLGWQILWGALFIRLFGFSFMAVKLSTLPLAVACVFLFYFIQIRFGIGSRNAILGTLALVLSPLFLPLAASFMSDIPGLFVILLCLYCCQRAVAAGTSSSTIAWLAIAAATNVAGGTVRQIAWLGALAMVPATGWFLRKRRGVLPATLLLFAASFAVVLYCMHWFAAQPYSISDSLFKAPAHRHGNPWFIALVYLCGEFFCLLLVLFPILAAWLPRLRLLSKTSLLGLTAILLFWILFQTAAHWTLPWIPHLIQSEFSLANYAQIGADRGPLLLPKSAGLLFSAVITAAFLLVLHTVRAWFHADTAAPRALLHEPIFWLLVPYSLSYCALLYLNALQAGGDFDRYLLGLMPVAILSLTRLYERRIAPRLPAIAAITIALYALLAVAGTHDWFAWQRARLAAISELRSAGIPRTQIQGGFEYDGWTQIETAGHLNDPRIQIPAGAYHPDLALFRVSPPCRLDFAPFTPAVALRYTTAFPPLPCLNPTPYPSVPYRTWLPPFQRTIPIQQFPASYRFLGTGSELPGMYASSRDAGLHEVYTLHGF